MSNEAEVTRKKKTRGAHRASVTKTITQVYENINATDGPNKAKLEQQKLALSDKNDVLSKLNAELINLVNEDDLDKEIQHCGEIKYKIDLALIDIDIVLNRKGKRRSRTSSSSSVDSDSSATSSTVPLTDVVPPVTEPSIDVVPPVTDPSIDVVPPTTEISTVTNTPVLALPPVTSVSIIAGSTPIVTPSTLHSVPVTTAPPITPQVKLPKLSLKRFNGDLTKWTAFWDLFSSSIHSNPGLSNVDKFSYLTSLLESTASEAIAGLTITSANYQEAIATLHKRFGNRQLIVNRHMDALLSLGTDRDIQGLRRLRDVVESHVRGLRALGVSLDCYGGLLISILMNKLPPELKLLISRELTGDEWNIDHLMIIVDREVTARERTISSVPPKKPNFKLSPTASGWLICRALYLLWRESHSRTLPNCC